MVYFRVLLKTLFSKPNKTVAATKPCQTNRSTQIWTHLGAYKIFKNLKNKLRTKKVRFRHRKHKRRLWTLKM